MIILKNNHEMTKKESKRQTFEFTNINKRVRDRPGNTKGGSITVPLTSCLTGLESAV
jgi:hypothetical protein